MKVYKRVSPFELEVGVMRKLFATLCIFSLSLPLVVGCQGAKQNEPRLIDYKEDIRFFTRSAVRILLLEQKGKISEEDLTNIKKYVGAAVDVIDNDEDPEFDDLRALIVEFLPEEYAPIGLSLVDVVERYVLNHILDNLDDKQKEIKTLILCGLKGAQEAVSDAETMLFPPQE